MPSPLRLRQSTTPRLEEPKTVTSSKSLIVEVAAYDPHFTALASYLMLNMPGETAFQKPFAVIVRYDGR